MPGKQIKKALQLDYFESFSFSLLLSQKSLSYLFASPSFFDLLFSIPHSSTSTDSINHTRFDNYPFDLYFWENFASVD
jgi:hypothetical protein